MPRATWVRSRVLVAVGLALLVAGCGGRARGLFGAEQTETAPGATRVEMLVATTRKTSADNPADMFSGDRGPQLSFADIAISIPPDDVRQVGEVQWPSKLPADPAREFTVLRARPVALPEARNVFRRLVSQHQKRRAFVFVHGYNNRFDDAVFRFAQIVHDSGAPGAAVLFTWPSRGTLLGYTYDRESTNYSRDALEEVLRALVAAPNVQEVSILAHSMGNWLTLETLRQMAIRDGRLPAKIVNVMLAAPDVDVDVFKTQINQIKPRPDQFTLFVSQDDRALAVSRSVWGSTARLGAIDPGAEPFRSALERDGIRVIDLTKLASGDSLNHGKFAESPEAVRMIGNRLAAGQDVGGARTGVGTALTGLAAGAAATVGNAASLAITVPLAVVDQNARDELGDRVEALGGSIGDTVSAPLGGIGLPRGGQGKATPKEAEDGD